MLPQQHPPEFACGHVGDVGETGTGKGTVMDPTVSPTPTPGNSYTEVLSSSAAGSGDRLFKEVIKIKVIRAGPWNPFKQTPHQGCTHTRKPHKDMGRKVSIRQPSRKQTCRDLDLGHPASITVRISVCCLASQAVADCWDSPADWQTPSPARPRATSGIQISP